jgi:hypothetical protein
VPGRPFRERLRDNAIDPMSELLLTWVVIKRSPTMRPHFSHDPSALATLKDIYNAEDIDKAQVAVKAFEIDFGAKYPKAVAKIVDDLDVLLEFYRYPAEHGSTCGRKPDRIDFCHSAAAHQGHQRPPDRAPLESPWPTSSSTPHRTAGAPSTPHT